MLAGLTALVLIVAAVLLLRPNHETAPPRPPIEVATAQVRPTVVPDVIETSGTIISPQTVEVRPQTGGVIERVLIGDGASVRKGQLLFTIDPRPLRSALEQASGALTRDRALAADAADSAQRYRPLAREGAVDDKTAITARHSAEALRGTVMLDRAQVNSARLSLAYTQVRAPISGRAGAIQVKPGNVVTADMTSPLVTLNVAGNVQASFALPRAQVDQVKRGAGGGPLAVEALDSISGKPLARGQLYFLDNSFDDSSGTLTVRARFPNPGEQLWPGQFVTIRVILSEAPVLAIPESSLQQGQQGPYVYVLANGRAAIRQLTVARMLDGKAVVTRGLRAGDTIILTVPNELHDGSAVRAAPQRGTAAAPAEAPRA
ncbi:MULTISPECIES: efflux RND transporter periplasmic adaptor subunit [Sphingomonas]|uniref:efflux RND transporter periplasmic adaptor subunit n=1 Tax=Sphingomonas TaxID=13687 RepID=UPI000DEEDDD9|nr:MULTISPECIES: efflux RND transporter periplasmic adaptor subunit [Sphingomonas]